MQRRLRNHRVQGRNIGLNIGVSNQFGHQRAVAVSRATRRSCHRNEHVLEDLASLSSGRGAALSTLAETSCWRAPSDIDRSGRAFLPDEATGAGHWIWLEDVRSPCLYQRVCCLASAVRRYFEPLPRSIFFALIWRSSMCMATRVQMFLWALEN